MSKDATLKPPTTSGAVTLRPLTEEESKQNWLIRYGYDIRMHMFMQLSFLIVVIMIDQSFIQSTSQMFATCATLLIITTAILAVNTRKVIDQSRNEIEVFAGIPYFVLNLYFIVQYTSIHSAFSDLYIFLLYYIILLLATNIHGRLRYKHELILNLLLLVIYDTLALLNLPIGDDAKMGDDPKSITWPEYILANFVLIFAKVR